MNPEQPLRDWFYPQAFIPSYYSGGTRSEEEATEALKKHLRRCKVIWVSEPHVGQIDGFGGDDEPDDRVLGIVATVACKCGRYPNDWKARTLFIPGDSLLRDLLARVTEGQ